MKFRIFTLVVLVVSLYGAMGFWESGEVLPGLAVDTAQLSCVFGELPNTQCTDSGIPCSSGPAGAGCGNPNANGVCVSAGDPCGACTGINDRVCRSVKQLLWCTQTPLKSCCDLDSCEYNGGTITVPPSCTCTDAINKHSQVKRNDC